jgi:hypothetical protein
MVPRATSENIWVQSTKYYDRKLFSGYETCSLTRWKIACRVRASQNGMLRKTSEPKTGKVLGYRIRNFLISILHQLIFIIINSSGTRELRHIVWRRWQCIQNTTREETTRNTFEFKRSEQAKFYCTSKRINMECCHSIHETRKLQWEQTRWIIMKTKPSLESREDTWPKHYKVRQRNSRNGGSVSLGCCVMQTHVPTHVWTCSNLRLHEPQQRKQYVSVVYCWRKNEWHEPGAADKHKVLCENW